MNESELIALTMVGFCIFLAGLINLYRLHARRHWPETIGKILKNEQQEVFDYPSSNSSTSLISKHTARPIQDKFARKSRLRFRYVYVVDGGKYFASQIFSAPVLPLLSNNIPGIKEGDKVKVFYKAANPNVAFLAHSYSWPSLLVVLLGFIVVAAGFYFKFMS